MNAYVIGDNDMITGFRLVGVEGVEADTVEDAQQALSRALTKTDIGIIIISQEYFSNPAMQEQVDKIRSERISPLIVEIPASKGTSKQPQLSEIISKILGIKI
jgi:vacuolar-type H+-ATPase subunit F/Vma7